MIIVVAGTRWDERRRKHQRQQQWAQEMGEAVDVLDAGLDEMERGIADPDALASLSALTSLHEQTFDCVEALHTLAGTAPTLLATIRAAELVDAVVAFRERVEAIVEHTLQRNVAATLARVRIELASTHAFADATAADMLGALS